MGRNTFILIFLGCLVFIATLIPSKLSISIHTSSEVSGDLSKLVQPLLSTHKEHLFEWSTASSRWRICNVDPQKERVWDAYQNLSSMPNSPYMNDYYSTFQTSQTHP